MKSTEQYFLVVLFVVVFVVLYKVVLTIEPLGYLLKCDHSSEIYSAVLFQDGSKFRVSINRPLRPLIYKPLSSIFPWNCLLCCTRAGILPFEYLDGIL